MSAPQRKRSDLAIRLGGLLLVALVGMLVALCGLSLFFGYRRVSVILFCITIGLLIAIKSVVTIMNR